ncbi:methylated-DNA--[protein]-cysteine S-methyltransferase [Mangrovihabitans endophyticus]|uniref:Putative methylated-DNA:protein-cysteine methyltransferase n=1 Tax=Mangrovihabitans endophyticus TaxID=1751298 RepID=A0A8J3C5T4_9ACTN|nr:methylated-DNA--[protein]-cysteine S-methyltransferase [Mangrovihabitans endophyticus]GGL19250.1 putative methylated-DNA:protein-cysteine methyltransferase [Mangrovihabitans endophyticus]
MLQHTTMDTPAGPLTLVAGAAGAVRAAGFTTDVDALCALMHPSLREPVRPVDDLGRITDAVRAYLRGDLTAIDAIRTEQRTRGPFLTHAWQVMREIKPGAPVTYTAFADMAGRPAAVRGAAAACARNPVALFTPCHRVLRTDGSLGGYRWGLDVKRWLLDHERAA